MSYEFKDGKLRQETVVPESVTPEKTEVLELTYGQILHRLETAIKEKASAESNLVRAKANIKKFTEMKNKFNELKPDEELKQEEV